MTDEAHMTVLTILAQSQCGLSSPSIWPVKDPSLTNGLDPL